MTYGHFLPKVRWCVNPAMANTSAIDSNKPLSRKQREISERENRILDTAQQLLAEEGYLGLTMARIAQRIDYSKGTIYQHFGCKEEVIMCLVIRSLRQLLRMFQDCFDADVCSRGRLMLSVEAYYLHIRLNPILFENFSTLKSVSIFEKVPVEKRDTLMALEVEVMEGLSGVLGQAVADGELDKPENLSIQELAFGIWAMLYGALNLELHHPDLSHLGIGVMSQVAKNNIDAYLDGMNWLPLSAEKNAAYWQTWANEKLFNDTYSFD